ncbi:hypothetical protein F1735_21055 [Massilia sp. CCM 8694]|uniref:Uncharacterized protein n=1 Tax=Massilia genomosp. 1 TaxID=2609280 RepID=A0ABX0MPR8_9BURK|nr:hypothetical protein [Massilia genomosp. 1]
MFGVLGLAANEAKADTKGKVLYGKLTYDRVPSTLENGLNYSAVVQKPIRNVRVVLVEYSKEGGANTELAVTTSGEDGSYSFPVPDLVTRVRVRAFAETANPPLRVQDNTNGNALYALESAAMTTTAAVTVKDLNAGSGWGGSSYTGARAAAPFASLDTLYATARAFMAVRPLVNFPLLPINWSVNNRPEPGDSALGQINTSHYNKGVGGIFILGKADVDTDEYDAHVMVHEWGHYFEDKMGRSDSIGGTHGSGDIVDPRLAFGEGWGNALSAMILFPDAKYKDTGGAGQARTTLVIDMETNDSDDPKPGWFSEASVQSVLYDLFDPANESFDNVALGLGPIYDIMTGGAEEYPGRDVHFLVHQGLESSPRHLGRHDCGNRQTDLSVGYHPHSRRVWDRRDQRRRQCGEPAAVPADDGGRRQRDPDVPGRCGQHQQAWSEPLHQVHQPCRRSDPGHRGLDPRHRAHAARRRQEDRHCRQQLQRNRAVLVRCQGEQGVRPHGARLPYQIERPIHCLGSHRKR